MDSLYVLIWSSLWKNQNTNKTSKLVRIFFLKIKGPNVGDLNSHFQKQVKPFIETPFIPTEVEKLQTHARQGAHDYSMSSAMLVGPKAAHTGSEVDIIFLIFRNPQCIVQ